MPVAARTPTPGKWVHLLLSRLIFSAVYQQLAQQDQWAVISLHWSSSVLIEKQRGLATQLLFNRKYLATWIIWNFPWDFREVQWLESSPWPVETSIVLARHQSHWLPAALESCVHMQAVLKVSAETAHVAEERNHFLSPKLVYLSSHASGYSRNHKDNSSCADHQWKGWEWCADGKMQWDVLKTFWNNRLKICCECIYLNNKIQFKRLSLLINLVKDRHLPSVFSSMIKEW